MRKATLFFAATLAMLGGACDLPDPIQLDLDDCVWDIWQGCSGPPDPTPTVLWVSLPTTGADPVWVGPELVIGDAVDEGPNPPPDVELGVAFNATIGFSQGRVGLGPHYLLLRELHPRCEVSGPNPQFVLLEEGEEKRVELPIVCR